MIDHELLRRPASQLQPPLQHTSPRGAGSEVSASMIDIYRVLAGNSGHKWARTYNLRSIAEVNSVRTIILLYY